MATSATLLMMSAMTNKGPTLGDFMGGPDDPDDFAFYAMMVTVAMLGLGAVLIFYHYGLVHHG